MSSRAALRTLCGLQAADIPLTCGEMLLDRFKDFWQGVVLMPFVKLFIKLGISPDAVTLVGTLGVVVGALAFFPRGELFCGVLFITAFVFSDLIDGKMARMLERKSRFGAFWDSTLDRIGDGAIFGGLALYFAGPGDDYLYLCVSLWCLVMGSVTSYARARAESLGMDAKGGLAERADRLVSILVMTGLGAIFDLPILMYVTLWALAAASAYTVVFRVLKVYRQAPSWTVLSMATSMRGRSPPPPRIRPMSEQHELGTTKVKRGMAEMLKGGVIMDVVTAEQAKIAEDAGAVAVMALERVPADIRAQGGVSRMSDPDMIDSIIEAVSIPVMAKARIGHFAEAQVLQSLGCRLHRRVRGADPGRLRQPHRQVGVHRAVRVRCDQPRRGAAPDHRGRGDDPLQGRGRHR